MFDFFLFFSYYYHENNNLEINMEAVEVTSLKDKLVISIDKSLVSKEYLLSLLNRLQLENLVKKADFDEKVLEVSEAIKTNWWKENKDNFLKG